jgi:hypothetical protein
MFAFICGIQQGICVTGRNVETDTSLRQKLSTIFPNSEITPIDNLEGYSQSYQIVLNEPLDHSHLEKGTFRHYIYLSHSSFNRDMVMVTEGYNARYVKNEVSTLLQTNQVIVEYRFYGKSKPTPVPWEYLTCDAAIEDYHAITLALKKLYSGKWIATGASKGGENTLIYRSKYPQDMDVSIPYVAPLINGPEDPRTQQHIQTVGAPACRAKIVDFQRRLLQNREAVLQEMNSFATVKNMQFTQVPMEEALEYAVLEFPFSFWQWGGVCKDIPDEHASAKQMFDYMNKLANIWLYSDQGYDELLPSFYQHLRELGYYGFDLNPVKDLLKIVKNSSNSRFAPRNVMITYDPNYIQKVREFVETKGNKILYIYGGYDTWYSCAPTPQPHVDALKMVLPQGSHATLIKNFSKEDQEKILQKLEHWLGHSAEKKG